MVLFYRLSLVMSQDIGSVLERVALETGKSRNALFIEAFLEKWQDATPTTTAAVEPSNAQ